MNNLQYNVQFEKLCHVMRLGEIVGTPEVMSGGLLHRMYAIQTTKGKYAIKALNPQIMRRPTAMENYIKSEQISNIAAKHIPALPAQKCNDAFIQKIDHQFYLVFDWVEGNSLKPNEIYNIHCEKIGAILADLHRTDFSETCMINEGSGPAQIIDWNHYLHKGEESNREWVNQLLAILDNLYEWNAQANKSAKLLTSDRVISHRDLDPKNVMWNQDNPIIIDWEAAGYINPMQELTETAVYWSEDDGGNLEKQRFLSFIGGYKKRYGILKSNWSTVLVHGFLGKLGWLEYNLKRSLWLECTDAEEQKLGTAQVTATICAIERYAEMIPELEKWLDHEV
ncbi:aminoglycoside phosphotransferase [Paenibacillus selenitireducens]|uniref:Aminoglycoside phosphotransferase n=1 Tax=Paenibacillus selenitireducens TaxID=1324314 RepID=A0A1T2XFH1_9BACL|nr:aminoglycoside phosphotransferase family protein [Paenibacillus selenitireducens]OPA78634.1 aminoglycoside phosphotransferase [Paenibacillus selenitireducens]